MTRTTAHLSCKTPPPPLSVLTTFCLLRPTKLTYFLYFRLFMHGGHTNHLADFSWNPNEPWLVASAAEDNLLQIWKVAESIVGKDDGDLPVDELDR